MSETEKWAFSVRTSDQDFRHDHFHVNVQKSVSYHVHENYVVTTKSVLMRMIVMKIWYFHGHTEILTELMRHQNLYISYGDTFMKQANLCTMYLNLSAQKSLESRNQDQDDIYHTKYLEFFYSDHGNSLALHKDFV